MAMSSNKLQVYSIFIFIFMVIANSSNGLRILGIFPLPVKSHFTMCEALMRGLAAQGHQVDVYSHFPLKSPIPNYTDFSLAAGNIETVTNSVTYDVVKITSPVESTTYWLDNYGKQLCDQMSLPIFQKLLKNPPNDPPYDIIINEISLINCYIPLANHLNIPIIGAVTLPLVEWMHEPLGTPVNLATEPGVLTSLSYPMSFFERLHNVIHYYRMNRAFAQSSDFQNEYVTKFFGPGYPNVVDLLKELSLVLVNHDYSLNGMVPFSPSIVPVPGLHIIDHNEALPKIVQKWLDDSKDGCIYFSFGSMVRLETFPTQTIKAIYKSFENIAPMRVLLKIAKPEDLPPGLPSNVLTQSWFDQIQVLKHKNVKAFVTHGGLMSTQEAIFYGVPLVGIPLFSDQHTNIHRFAKQKIAIKVDLDEITEETMTNALREITNNNLYRKNMNEASRKFKDRPMSPIETAIFWIEFIHRHGKHALERPIKRMPWWQANLFDVYGFIAFMITLLLFITAKISFIIYKLVFPLVLTTKEKKN